MRLVIFERNTLFFAGAFSKRAVKPSWKSSETIAGWTVTQKVTWFFHRDGLGIGQLGVDLVDLESISRLQSRWTCESPLAEALPHLSFQPEAGLGAGRVTNCPEGSEAERVGEDHRP